jgi:sulfur carrier protein
VPVRVTVNDQEVELPRGAAVSDLLAQLGLGDRRVAVERNLEIVPRAKHAETVLGEGDRLEIVTLVGGG